MGHGCRICQSVAVGTAVGVAVGSGSSHPAVVNVRKANSPPNHTEGRPTNFCVNSHPSRTATPSRRHPQGVHSRPDYLDHPYQVGSTIHTILSFDPGAPPNCFGRRLRSSSVRQPPFLAQIDPRQPQLIIGTLCAQELPDGSGQLQRHEAIERAISGVPGIEAIAIAIASNRASIAFLMQSILISLNNCFGRRLRSSSGTSLAQIAAPAAAHHRYIVRPGTPGRVWATSTSRSNRAGDL